MAASYIRDTLVASTCFYVDGFNLYHAVQALARPELKWLNLKDLAAGFLRPGDTLSTVCYFTAVQSHPPKKAARHRRYIDALSAQGVEIISSNFQRVQKYCRENDRNCRFQEEKRTDVALASRYLIDAAQGAVERIIIVTADSDQIPAVETIQVHYPTIEIELAIPPGRRGNARELASLFPKTPVELTAGRLGANLLPRSVYHADGRVAATCPAEWFPAISN